VKYTIDGSDIHIETDCIKATVRTEGYVSGVAAQTFVDKQTGAHDLGFGLSIVDFLLEPGEDEPDEPHPYHWGDKLHGNIPKRFVELPQICTAAKKLPYEVVQSEDAITVKLRFNWTIATRARKAGSLWEQFLVFPRNTRYFFSTDKVTSVNTVDGLALRVDMPGHLKHNKGDTFSQIYLSYHGLIPNDEFLEDFPPDAKFHYLRGRDIMPKRMIRAYKTQTGPWLAGMTLNPDDVSEAWCHQRGYVCFIEEVGGRLIQAGETFSVKYIIGYFDSIEEMEATYVKAGEQMSGH